MSPSFAKSGANGPPSQAFFIQDFPSHTPDPFLVDKPRENPTHTDLSRPLLSFLSKLKCPKKFAGPFANYDFSASKHGAKLVFTAQGKYVDEDEIAKGGGVDSLAKAVQQLGLEVSPRGMWEIELSVSPSQGFAVPREWKS